MFSRLLEYARTSLGFRLILWYSGIFLASCLIVFLVSYFFLSSSLKNHRDAILAESQKYIAQVRQKGLDFLINEIGNDPKVRRRPISFIRIIKAPHEVVYLSNPRSWEKFDAELQQTPADGEWRHYPATRDGDMLEVLSSRLPDGTMLQVGRSIQDREEILERLRDTLLAVMIPMILIGIAGGALLAHRALRPIQELSIAVREVIGTGNIEARVPMSRNKDELNELVRLFNQMLSKIELLVGRMREALDNVAHDLRTPMARMRASVEDTLQSSSDPAAYRDALYDCLDESERVLTMLETLMNVSEAETGAMRLSFDKVNISSSIREVVDLYTPIAEEKNVTLVSIIPDEIVLSADSRRLPQAFANLLDNAVKYTPAGGNVYVELSQSERQATILFKDSGIGIAAEEMPRIWERLFRGDRSRSERGLGLGLSLVKAVVQAHSGNVEVSQNPEGGSLFVVRLPFTHSA
jgi:signal transduction histidine kinase